MEKQVRYGLLLFIVLICGIILVVFTATPAYATEEEAEMEQAYTAAEKAAAIRAANDAIFLIPRVDYIVALDQKAVQQVAEARALVEKAKEEYDAVDTDFPNLAKLLEAEKIVFKLLAVKAAQDAIDAIPPLEEVTEEHRPLIEEARRLVNVAMQEYGATRFDICWRLDALKDAEEKIGEEEPEPTPPPKPPDDRQPTPPTGGPANTFSVAALLICGAGLFLYRQSRARY
ncbi:MAG TPA: hypothetical protein ENN91_00395 [Firmicutes bacterium]|nr:hypothetical protein [Bacillota bacterium]